jgi:Rrf2 family protein
MRLSKTSAQAALALAFLAGQPSGRPVQARHIAGYLGIPPDSALKILQALARQHLILSHLGRSGGYHLDKPPEEVTLLQIVEAIEGPISGHMALGAGPEAVLPGLDLLQAACAQAATGLRHSLSQTTVADLVRCNHPPAMATTP